MNSIYSIRRMAVPPISRSFWFFVASAVCFFIAPVFADDLGQQKSQDEAVIETSLRQAVEYLASDELQGRGPRTQGIDKAADYIAKRMGKMGLKTDFFQGGPYQIFYMRPGSEDSDIEDGNAIQLNVFSIFADAIHSLFVKIGELSSLDESPERPAMRDEGSVELKNVIGVLEGRGPLAEETILIGAHYDHLGERKTAGGQTVVFHGANDNASGVATMLETADIIAHLGKKLPRRIMFVAFSGEELGLLGSFHYLNHPAVPLDKTIAMINLDVVGRMEDNTLVSMGASTSAMLSERIDKIVKRENLKLDEWSWVYPVSDHAGFYSRGIPAVFFMTGGGWGDMHRPSDKANTLNYPGMRKIAQVTADLAVELAEADRRPEFAQENMGRSLYRHALRAWDWLSN